MQSERAKAAVLAAIDSINAALDHLETVVVAEEEKEYKWFTGKPLAWPVIVDRTVGGRSLYFIVREPEDYPPDAARFCNVPREWRDISIPQDKVSISSPVWYITDSGDVFMATNSTALSRENVAGWHPLP